MTKTIFTIGRQYGSGGRHIGEMLGEKLGIAVYDQKLIVETAKASGYGEAVIGQHDEKPMNSLLYSAAMGYLGGFVGGTNVPIPVQTFLAQYKTITDLAEKEVRGCIFVGRCADYVLRERTDVVNIFIVAPEAERIERIKGYDNLNAEQAVNKMHQVDRMRASYYNYYTEQKWGEAANYHLCIDSSRLGLEGCADLILAFAGQQ